MLDSCASSQVKQLLTFSACLALAIASAVHAKEEAAVQTEGSVGVEVRVFSRPPLHKKQSRHTGAVIANPTWKGARKKDKSVRFILSPYARFDARDQDSRFVDLREALVEKHFNDTIVRAGFGKVFWGVAESNHLIDIINQSDLRVDVEGEAKLGQPMVAVARHTKKHGRVELFYMPTHRARPFPGKTGRLRPEPVDGLDVGHGLGRFRRHNDWALRWSRSLEGADLGAYYFAGLSREPDIIPAGGPQSPELVTRYRKIRQLGLDLQLPKGNMLWKLEALRREGHGDPFSAFVAGGEYTLTLPRGDLGLLVELSRDYRDATAPSTAFADSLFTGLRFGFSESGDAQLLAGIIHEQVSDARLFKVEFSRRLDDHVRLALVGRKFSAEGREGPYTQLRRDDHLQVTFSWFF